MTAPRPFGDSYGATADTLGQRILDLIPTHPEIMEFTEPWTLFKVEGFKCDDLQPSYAQAAGALAWAKARHREASRG